MDKGRDGAKGTDKRDIKTERRRVKRTETMRGKDREIRYKDIKEQREKKGLREKYR